MYLNSYDSGRYSSTGRTHWRQYLHHVTTKVARSQTVHFLDRPFFSFHTSLALNNSFFPVLAFIVTKLLVSFSSASRSLLFHILIYIPFPFHFIPFFNNGYTIVSVQITCNCFILFWTPYEVHSVMHISMMGSAMCWSFWGGSESSQTAVQRNWLQPCSVKHRDTNGQKLFVHLSALMTWPFISLQPSRFRKCCGWLQWLVVTPQRLALSRSLWCFEFGFRGFLYHWCMEIAFLHLFWSRIRAGLRSLSWIRRLQLYSWSSCYNSACWRESKGYRRWWWWQHLRNTTRKRW